MKEFESIFAQMDRFMDRVFDREHLGYLHMVRIEPPMDVYETEEDVVLLLELPGVTLDDVNVTEHKGVLTIRGLRRDPSPSGRIRCHHMELVQGNFERQVRLPLGVDKEQITAKLKEGLLTVSIRKEQS